MYPTSSKKIAMLIEV